MIGAIIGGIIGTAAGGNTAAGATAGGAVEGLFSGNATDQARQAKVAYFVGLAVNGNVGAMQILLGSPASVSGNERPYWIQGQQTVQQQNPAVYAAGQAAGPKSFAGAGDTEFNYPAEKNYALQWAATNAPVGVAAAPGAAPASPIVPPMPTPSGATQGAQSLPVVQVTAPRPSSATGIAAIGVMILVVVLAWLVFRKLL